MTIFQRGSSANHVENHWRKLKLYEDRRVQLDLQYRSCTVLDKINFSAIVRIEIPSRWLKNKHGVRVLIQGLGSSFYRTLTMIESRVKEWQLEDECCF